MPVSNRNPSGSFGPAYGPAAQLAVPSLGPVVQELFAAGLAASTRGSYPMRERRYIIFCQTSNLVPFPVTEPTLIAFVASLYTQRLVTGTVKSYLAAVRHAQIAIGLGDPQIGTMPQLEYVLKGLKKKVAGRQHWVRLSITPGILCKLKRV